MKIIQTSEDGKTVKSREPLSVEAVERIARWNGNMTPDQVREALVSGGVIYTNFSKWYLG